MGTWKHHDLISPLSTLPKGWVAWRVMTCVGRSRHGGHKTFSHPPRRGPWEVPFFLWAAPSQLWGHEVADVPGISAARVALQSTSSLITLCLNCSVTQGRV